VLLQVGVLVARGNADVDSSSFRFHSGLRVSKAITGAPAKYAKSRT
jgi:hypothetical protein